MEIIRISANNITQLPPIVACIGVFDAMHIAHQKLLLKTFEYSQKKAVITFVFDKNVHIHKPIKNYINNQNQRQTYIQQLGFDYYIEIVFDEVLKNMSPKQFIEYLHRLNVQVLMCGFDFQFGKNREGKVDFLKQNPYFEVVVMDEIQLNYQKVSTSHVQHLITNGNIEAVTKLLDREYCVQSKVIEGKKLGRTIGYPTANLDNKKNYVIPQLGVYFGYVKVRKQNYPAMISVGLNPTVEQLTTPVIEAHILDFNENIYGEVVEVCFKKRIRDELKFDSLEALISQLKKDEQTVRKLLCD